MTAEGLRANEFLPYGRLAQSIAFFNAPGIERLYSGVTNSTASTAAIAALNSRRHRQGSRVVVTVVEREVLERNLRHVEFRRGRGAPGLSRAGG